MVARSDFDDACGKERRGPWDQRWKGDGVHLQGKHSSDPLPSQVQAGLGQGSDVGNDGIEVL